jgi:ribosome-associated toxin RatA of RatAB toxin-antitoxin module
MDIENSVLIKGDKERIYQYAAKVECWPKILPHYRSVEILETTKIDRLVSMHCVRSFGIFRWPCKWQARQELDQDQGRIYFLHVSGPVKGMRVAWILNETPDGVVATIKHERPAASSFWQKFYFDDVAGLLFIKPIASQTLETIKKIVEGESS